VPLGTGAVLGNPDSRRAPMAAGRRGDFTTPTRSTLARGAR
jgi:hypothetical protein